MKMKMNQKGASEAAAQPLRLFKSIIHFACNLKFEFEFEFAFAFEFEILLMQHFN